MKVSTATIMTAGTKYPATRSTVRWIGAFELWACFTILMIWASIVSAPTRVARKRNDPVLLIVAPTTNDPSVFSTGIGSPVTIDSSTTDAPDRTSPSTGTFSPGLTTTTSPTTTSEIGTSSSCSPLRTRAVFA